MCFFPIPTPLNSIAHKKGVTEYGCGVCPECLRKKSNYWALKCSAQAKTMNGMMITLTYDQYIRDGHGNIIGECLPEDMSVHKRDCQLFIKRLRKYIDTKGHGEKIKYLISAEYGHRTHRPHYHAIIFGYQFSDIVPYKKSKRGNMIYRSHTLEKIWKNGICTVDSINISGAVARYCTKYAMKDAGADDTFMLFSRGIGDDELLRTFNGKSYYVDGTEHAIPRMIWLKWCEQRFASQLHGATHKYVRGDEENEKARERLYKIRDNSRTYKEYLEYWKAKIATFDQPSVLQRILALDNSKYFSYKQAALEAFNRINADVEDYSIPRENPFRKYRRDLRTLYCKYHVSTYIDYDTGEIKYWQHRRGFMPKRPFLTFVDYCNPFNNPFGAFNRRYCDQVRLVI